MADSPLRTEEDVGAQMFPTKTTDEQVAEIVAAEPWKHSTTLARRIAIAREQSDKGDFAAWERFTDNRIREIGGDPAEMMPGNKPRYTVNEETGAVKDHDTGAVHSARAPADHVSDVLPGDSEALAPGRVSESDGERSEDGAGAAPADRALAGPDDGDGIADGADIDSAVAGPAAGGEPSSEQIAGQPGAAQAPEAGAASVPGPQVEQETTGGTEGEGAGGTDSVQCAPEAHSWPEPVEDKTPCEVCGLTFLQWAQQ